MSEGERIARLEERSTACDRWQESQNGRLDKIDKRLNDNNKMMVSLLAAVITTLIGVIVDIAGVI